MTNELNEVQASVNHMMGSWQAAPINYRVPASRRELGESAQNLDDWATASEWAKAALVYAYVSPSFRGSNQHTEDPNNGILISAQAFSKIGIAGLKSDTTISLYWSMWRLALDKGWTSSHPSPGQRVMLPAKPWKEARQILQEQAATGERKQPGDNTDSVLKYIDTVSYDNEDLIARIEARCIQWRARRNQGA